MKTTIYAIAAVLASTVFVGAEEIRIPKSAAEDTDHIMSQKYWDVWNPELQRKIDADIEAYRKADAVVKIGKVKEGQKVVVEQISHDFIFGAHIFNFDQLGSPEMNAKYKALYGTLFNSATVALYWNKFEMQPERPRFKSEYWDSQKFWNEVKDPKVKEHWRRPAPENVIKFCKEMGIRIHGHPLIWDTRSWHMPTWLIKSCLTDKAERELFEKEILKSYPVYANKCLPEKYTEKYKQLTPKQLSQMFPIFAANMKKAFANRIISLADYYGDTIDSWDVVNESAFAYELGMFKAAEGATLMKTWLGIMPADYTFEAFKLAEKKFPASVKLNINDYNTKECYNKQIAELLERGAKIDIVGAQMHLFNPKTSREVSEGKIPGGIDPKKVFETMDRLGKLDRPIHLSEITITAVDTTERGRMIQAIITRNAYRMWFSVKPMMGITWWNVVDDCGAPGEPSLSGIFTRGMNPKPAFYALNELINKEWRTNLELTPDQNGDIKFKGFKGKYRIAWFDADGKEQFKIVHVK